MIGGWQISPDILKTEQIRLDVLKVILYELNNSIGPREKRMNAIHTALSELNHSDHEKHDQELDLQADKIIFQKLAFSFCINKMDQEVGLLSSALELVYRGSRARVALSFNEIGESILPLLVQIIQGDCKDEINKSPKNESIFAPINQHKPAYSNIHEDPIVTKVNDLSNMPTLLIANEQSQYRKVKFFGTDEDLHQYAKKAEMGKYTCNLHAVEKILKVLRYFSRVLSAMISMARQPGLLDALIYQLQWLWKMEENNRIGIHISQGNNDKNYPPINNNTSTNETHETNHQSSHDSNLNINTASKPPCELFSQVQPAPPYHSTSTARVDAIATIVNLACAEENKSKMLYHPGLLDAVIFVAKHDPSDEAREHAAIVLMNLAYSESNKLFMACQEKLLDVLTQLVTDKSPYTRRYASGTIFALACVDSNTVRIARHSQGEILAALTHLLINDQVEEVRINAAEGLFNMARNNTEDTLEIMGNHSEVFPKLAQSVLSDYSADVRAFSARALEWFAADIHSSSTCHSQLLDALTIAAAWTKTTCIAQALKLQSTLPENRKSMVEHKGLLDAVANLASLQGISNEEVRKYAIVTIEQLTMEESTRIIMARHAKIMTVLTSATFAKTGLLLQEDDEAQNVKRLRKVALKNLAEVL